MLNLKSLTLWKNPVIEFAIDPNLFGVVPAPEPASKSLPKWFKNLHPFEPNVIDRIGNQGMTAKKCLPLLDAMSYGFTIPLCGDARIKSNHDCSHIDYFVNQSFPLVEFHESWQVGGKSVIREHQNNIVKFINPWVIKTAPGWSALFIAPLNNFNSHFTILSGIVDTDRYTKPVNLPALWNTPNFDDVLKSGTPLATVIPVQRNLFDKNPNIRELTKKEVDKINKTNLSQNLRPNVYNNELREKR